MAELEALEKKKNEINESDYQKKRETIFKSLQETDKEIATQIENLSKSPFLSENSRKELTDVKTYYQTDKRQASTDDSFFNEVRKKDQETQQKVSNFDKEVKENKRLAVEQLNEQQSKGEPWYKNYKAFNKLQKIAGYEIWYKATADWIKDKRSIGTVFFLPDNKTLLLHTSEALPTDGENPPSTTEVTKKEGYFYYYNEDFDNKWHKVVDLPSSYKKLDLEPLFIEGYKELGRMLSFENGLILITGKDFDGEEASRLKAGGFLILEFAPVGRIWRVVKEPLKVAVSGVKGTFRTLAFEGGKWVSKTGIDKKAIEYIGKTVKKAISKKIVEVDNFMLTPEFKQILTTYWNKYKGKLPYDKWEDKFKTLYRNREIGTITEETFNKLMGSNAVQLEIQVVNSKRVIDNVLNGVAREVKSGKVTCSKYNDQVMKDIKIIKDNLSDKVDKIEWHCFDEVDPKFIQNVKAEVQKAGLKESDFIIIKY